MKEKKIPVSIKMDSALFEELEKRRGDKGRGPFIEEILMEYFSKGEKYDIQEYPEMIENLKEENAFLRERIDRLETMLNQEQSLHLKTQKMLPGAKGKRWWQFWK